MKNRYISSFTDEKTDSVFKGAYVFSTNGRNFLLNRDDGSSVVLDDRLLNQLESRELTDDLQFKLIQRGFMTIEGGELPRSDEEILPVFFIIDLTRACNFRCVYCFRHLDQASRTLTDERLDDMIDYITNYCNKYGIKEINLQPWGGEPLLAWDKIKKLQDELHGRGIKTMTVIESNVSLVTPQIAREAFERDIRIGVSIDGFPELHNEQRLLMNGEPSFEKMLEGMKNLRDAGFGQRHGVISVFTRNSLPHLEKMLDYMAFDLQIDRLRLNIVKDSPVMKDKGLCLKDEEIPDYERRLVRKIVEINDRGVSFTEINMLDKLHNLLDRKSVNICNSRGCMGGKKMVAFSMDGDIYPCDVMDYPEEAVGSIYDGRDLVDSLKEVHKNKPYFAPKKSGKCEKCPWWFYCKGGCTTAIKYKKECITGIDSAECNTNNTLYPLLIELILTRPELIGRITKNELEIL